MTDPNQEVTGAPAADQSATQNGAPSTEPAAAPTPPLVAGRATPIPQVPSLGRIVIVRESGKKDAPGIIAELSEDEIELEETITCNVFPGDHIPPVAPRLAQTAPANPTATGWFWPPRV